MPNWCENALTISGEPAEVARFLKFARGKELNSDEKYDPANPTKTVPISLRKFIKPRHSVDWFWWNFNNWGSKWHPDFEEPIFSSDKSVAVFNFSSAWSPIVPVLGNMSVKFPTLRFVNQYLECGMWFAGTAVAEDGVLNDVAEDITRETHPQAYFDDDEDDDDDGGDDDDGEPVPVVEQEAA